jgi:hypothetical protein
MPRSMTRRLALISVSALAAGAAFAGCGGDDGGGEASGPATVVPQSALVYADVTLKPEGEAKTGAEAALSKLTGGGDPVDKIASLIEQSAFESGEDVDFATDIEPWLGEKAAVFFTNFDSDADGAVVVETTDADAAKTFFDEQKDEDAKEASYEGADYTLDSDGDAAGIVGDFVVSGSEQGFKDAVDAESGDSLADEGEFTDSIDDLPEDRLASFFAMPKDILDAVPAEELPAEQRDIIEKTAGDAIDEPVLGDVTAAADGVELEFSAGSTGVETAASTLLTELPSQAWLGLGFGDLGEGITQGLEQAKNADIPNFDPDQISSQIATATGHDLEEIAGALGQAALFVEGVTVQQLSGALIIESKDPAVTADLLTRVNGLISAGGSSSGVKVAPLASTGGDQGFTVTAPSQGLAKPLTVVQRDDRLVFAYGPAAATQALEGSAGQGLSSSPAFAAAEEKIGDLGIDSFVSLAPVFQLAESEGAASDPDFQQAKPYIDALDYVALGSGESDGRALLKFVIGLK